MVIYGSRAACHHSNGLTGDRESRLGLRNNGNAALLKQQRMERMQSLWYSWSIYDIRKSACSNGGLSRNIVIISRAKFDDVGSLGSVP